MKNKNVSEDFTMTLLNDSMKELYEEWKAEGLSDDEIILRVTDTKLENAIEKVTDAISSDCIEWLSNNMYDQLIDDRAYSAEFIARNERLWNRGFLASEAMYMITIESAQAYSDMIAESSKKCLKGREYTYLVLQQLHGRACQQFLEILHLLKGGFADGANARWRSLYELSVISEFIRRNGEMVAKEYYKESFSDSAPKNGWAKAAPCFSSWKGKGVPFDKIQEQCSFANSAWKNQYLIANHTVHASPQGTFDRLSVPSMEHFTPVGRSDYGLAMPATNSAISLAMISADFFISVPSGDGIVYIKTISKWSDAVRKCYTEIEKTCFGNQESNS